MIYPNKIMPVSKSVIGNMLIILEEFKGTNFTLDFLLHKLSKKMDVVDMIDAMTCLYAVGRIDFKDHQIIVL